LLPALLVLLAGGLAAAENIDPGGDDSQYAWGAHPSARMRHWLMSSSRLTAAPELADPAWP
jgi:hypothetical protein